MSKSVQLDSDIKNYAFIPPWVIADARLSHRDFRVLAAFMTFAGLDDIYPSKELIAERAGLTNTDSVLRSIKALTSMKYLSKFNRYDEAGKQLSNGYLIDLKHSTHEGLIQKAKVRGRRFVHPRQNVAVGVDKTSPKVDKGLINKRNARAYSELLVNEYKRRGLPLDNPLVRSQIDDAANDLSSTLDRKGLPNPYYMSVDDLTAMIEWLQEPAQAWVDFSASSFTSKGIRAKFATRKVTQLRQDNLQEKY